MFIEEISDKASKRYNTAQPNPYVDDSEEVVINFMSSLNKTIANYRVVDDGGAYYSSKTYRSESTAGKSKNSVTHSQTTEHSPSNASNVFELIGILNENILRHLTEAL